MCIYVYTYIYKYIKYICTIYIHIHTIEYYSALKTTEILPFATTWMDLEGIMLSEISHGGNKVLYISTYMWNLTNKKITKQNR